MRIDINIVANNTSKHTVFSAKERVDIIREVFRKRDSIKVVTFEGLLVEYCRKHGYRAILRGLRTVSDFEFEFQIAHANRHMYNEVDTIFMMTESEYSHLSFSIIKQIISMGGEGKGMIPPPVERELKRKYGFATGTPRSGKRRKR